MDRRRYFLLLSVVLWLTCGPSRAAVLNAPFAGDLTLDGNIDEFFDGSGALLPGVFSFEDPAPGYAFDPAGTAGLSETPLSSVTTRGNQPHPSAFNHRRFLSAYNPNVHGGTVFIGIDLPGGTGSAVNPNFTGPLGPTRGTAGPGGTPAILPFDSDGNGDPESIGRKVNGDPLPRCADFVPGDATDVVDCLVGGASGDCVGFTDAPFLSGSIESYRVSLIFGNGAGVIGFYRQDALAGGPGRARGFVQQLAGRTFGIRVSTVGQGASGSAPLGYDAVIAITNVNANVPSLCDRLRQTIRVNTGADQDCNSNGEDSTTGEAIYDLPADLVLAGNCPGAPVAAGGLLVFSGSVSNAGLVPLTNVIVVGDQPAPGTLVLGPITLSPGERREVTNSFLVPAAQAACTLAHTFTATADHGCDGTPLTRNAAAGCPVLPAVSLVVTRVCGPAQAGRGGTLLFTGSVSNSGATALTNVLVEINRPGSGTPVTNFALLAPGEARTFAGSYVVPLTETNCVISDTLAATGRDVCAGGLAGDMITVTCPLVCASPLANNDTATGRQNTPLIISGTNLLANDFDADGGTLIIVGVSTNSAQGGTVQLAGGEVIYTPPPGFVGLDTFTYTISDDQGGSSTATVTINVRPPNTAPVANNDTDVGLPNTALVIAATNLLANDFDADGDMLIIVGASTNSAQGGTVQLAGGEVIYTPPPGFVGLDTFTYTISDDQGGSSTATVTINVRPPNTAPVANNDTDVGLPNTALVIAATNLLANDFDADGDMLIIVGASTNSTQGGTVQLVGGEVIYTPPPGFVGMDTFTYTVSDGQGGSSTATVTINVRDPPITFDAAPAILNPQTGLFEQSITVLNNNAVTVPAMQVCILGLRTNIQVWNATGIIPSGTNAGAPYLQYNSPLDPGESAVIRVEYYVPDRRPFTPVFVLKPTQMVPVPTSTNAAGVTVDRCFLDSRLPDEPRLVVEFTSLPGRRYMVIYSDDLIFWKTATPSFIATGNRAQWYDDGPPKTDLKPLRKGSRFYRVILAP